MIVLAAAFDSGDALLPCVPLNKEGADVASDKTKWERQVSGRESCCFGTSEMDDIPFLGRGTFGAGVQRQIKSRPASNGLEPAVLGVLKLRFSILGRLASSVLMEAARFRVIGRRGGSPEGASAGVGGGGGPEEDKGAVGEVSDPCCLAAATAGAAPAAGLAAMAERVRGPVGAEWCRCWCSATTSVIFLGRGHGRQGAVGKRMGMGKRGA